MVIYVVQVRNTVGLETIQPPCNMYWQYVHDILLAFIVTCRGPTRLLQDRFPPFLTRTKGVSIFFHPHKERNKIVKRQHFLTCQGLEYYYFFVLFKIEFIKKCLLFLLYKNLYDPLQRRNMIEPKDNIPQDMKVRKKSRD